MSKELAPYKTKIVDLYLKEQKSVEEIAEIYNTYGNAVRRFLKKIGVPLRNRGQALKVALATGKREHPTKGKKLSEETKDKIAESLAESWENMTDEELQKRKEKSKQHWNSLSDEFKANLSKKGIDAIRKAGKEGSAMEHAIAGALRELGYTVYQHRNILQNGNLEVDMFVPTHSTVIEIDGPSHYDAIWGEKTLKRNQKSDSEKNGLVVQHGFCIIRLRTDGESVTRPKLNKAVESLDTILKSVEKSLPPLANRVIHI